MNQKKIDIDELLSRSVDTIYPNQEFLEKVLKSNKKLNVYMGIDPTATYVHLGHATNYIVLKRFHDLGHKVTVLVGDFTAMIGDPSDKSSARKRLSNEQVQKNMDSFKDQIGKIIDFKDKDNPISFRFNSEWLSKMKFEDVVNLAANFTVQQMIERDIFQKRIKEKKPLFLNEFFYPLMQGYDSVALNADVEVGGTDQTFNMLAGRQLVKNLQNREKIVISTTLLENPVTGEKLMSKSLGTGIALNDSPKNMFGKVMALPDEAIIQLFIDCTYLPMPEIIKIEDSLKKGANPRDMKLMLAEQIVETYHNSEAARAAKKEFEKVFSNKGTPSNMPEVGIEEGSYGLSLLLVNIEAAPSITQARKLIEQGAVKIDKTKLTDPKVEIAVTSGMTIQVGKLNWWRVR